MSDEPIPLTTQELDEFKAAMMREKELAVEAARRELADAEAQLLHWSKQHSTWLRGALLEDRRFAEAKAEADAKQERRERLHASALYQANEYGKGMLAPQGNAKWIWFVLFGASIGMLLALHFGVTDNGIKNVWAQIAIGGLGAIAGLFAGWYFYDANFVVDESLEWPGVFQLRSTATVRETYFRKKK
jgi:hypothetical protein